MPTFFPSSGSLPVMELTQTGAGFVFFHTKGSWPNSVTDWVFDPNDENLTSLTLRMATLTTFSCAGNLAACTFNLSACTALTSIDVSGNTAQTTYTFTGFSNLATFIVSGCALLGTLTLNHNALTSVVLNGCVALDTIDLSHNNLSAATQESIMGDIDVDDVEGGTLLLNNNAQPTNILGTNYLALIAKTWSITPSA